MSLNLTVNNKRLNLHYLTVVGSTLHQLSGESSDVDVKGVFTWGQDTVNGLTPAPEQLDNKNMSKEDRAELMQQLNNLFNRNFDEDLDLFEGRKFFKNAMKSEPNMLDMLYADTVPDMVLYCDENFQKVLDNRKLFVNQAQAKQRFLGMSFNTFKLGKKNGRSKDLAKSLQTLYSFKNLVENGEYNPVLKNSQKAEVQAVKFNTYMMEHEKLVETVNAMRTVLEEECNSLELEEYKDNFDSLNNLLLGLHNL